MKAIRIRQAKTDPAFKKVLDDPTVQGVLLLIPPGKCETLRKPSRRVEDFAIDSSWGGALIQTDSEAPPPQYRRTARAELIGAFSLK